MAMQVRASGIEGDEGETSDGGIVSEINITPLVDIFLVLLIIFMVTSTAMTQMGLEVQLPQVSSQQNTASDSNNPGVVVTLTASGGIQVNGTMVVAQSNQQGAEAQFVEKLTLAFKSTKSRQIVLEGDRQAFLGSAIEVMDWAKKAGAEQFSIATQAK